MKRSQVKRKRGQPIPSDDDSDGEIEIVPSKHRRLAIETIDLTSD